MKVICIKDDEWPAWAKAIMTDFPKRGVVYSVRDIILGQTTDEIIKDPTGKNPFNFKGTVMPVILLEEIRNPIPLGKTVEAGFRADRFAELPEQPKEEVKEKIKNPKLIKLPKIQPKPKIKELELV